MNAKWTVMVYMAGNNSLSGAASDDLAELRRVGSTAAVKVAAFIKQKGADATQRIVGKKAGDDVVSKLPGTADSGAPQTVIDFARWAIENAPADRYALVLWNHGGGWSPDDFDQLYQHVRGGQRNRHESNRLSTGKLKRTVFTPSIEKIVGIEDARERMICSDDSSGHSLDTIEVGDILTKLTQQIGRPLDLFGMDACLMSTLEVVYQVRKQAVAVVGSEELEPGAGWKYDALLTALNKTPTMDGRALAAAVVETYVDSYRNDRASWPVTQCAVDTSHCDAFAATVDGLVKALRATLTTEWTGLFKAQAHAVSFEFEMTDLRSLCAVLTASPDPGVAKAARAVVEALAPGGYVIAEKHLGDKVAACGGVSMYLPSPVNSELSPYYKDLALAKKHRWDELLRDYFRAVRE